MILWIIKQYYSLFKLSFVVVTLDDPGYFFLQMTVKKTLSNFRRTHHDNWHDHKQMFTDDQLVILTDLLVSPTYYA